MTGEVAEPAAAQAVSETEDKEAAAAFASGFDGEAAQPEAKEAPVAAQPAAEKPGAAEATAETPPADKAAEPKPAAPKYVRITQEQLDELLGAATKVKEFGSRFDKLAGTTGSLKQAIDKLQAETPKGERFDPAALAELKKDFPEIAGHLERILGGLKGTGTEAPPARADKPAATVTSDPDLIRKEANEKQFADELEELKSDYPDWQDIVGQSDTPDQKNPFRQWLKGQTAEYQQKINDTLSPRVIARAIDRFRAATATPRPAQGTMAKPAQTPAASSRRNVVANAVTPKTAGGSPQARSTTLEDEFAAGFAQG